MDQLETFSVFSGVSSKVMFNGNLLDCPDSGPFFFNPKKLKSKLKEDPFVMNFVEVMTRSEINFYFKCTQTETKLEANFDHLKTYESSSVMNFADNVENTFIDWNLANYSIPGTMLSRPKKFRVPKIIISPKNFPDENFLPVFIKTTV